MNSILLQGAMVIHAMEFDPEVLDKIVAVVVFGVGVSLSWRQWLTCLQLGPNR